MSSGPQWRIGVDTGGTFTDCLGVDRTGRWARAKVLSSGGLRIAVAERPDPRSLVLAGPETFVDGFFAGWQLEWLGEEVPIVGSTGNHLELAQVLSDSESPSWDEVLLRSPEDATVVAVRMVTGTAPGTALPEIALRLATTRGTNALLERKGARVAPFGDPGIRRSAGDRQSATAGTLRSRDPQGPASLRDRGRGRGAPGCVRQGRHRTR